MESWDFSSYISIVTDNLPLTYVIDASAFSNYKISVVLKYESTTTFKTTKE
jgi:hypothetical protein